MTDEQQAARRHVDGVSEGGDPVCWLEQVCDACGAMRENPSATACARCGTPFPGPQSAPAAAPAGERNEGAGPGGTGG